MAIYGKDGTELTDAFDVDGTGLMIAYNVDGDVVFEKNPTLKVCTYNVGGWYDGSGTNVPADKDSAYYELQNGIISGINADILCCEEYWTTFSKAGRTAESLLSQYYPYIETRSGTTTYYGRAICSKYPIVNYTVHTFTGESRYYDCAEINVNGTTIYVFVTHLHPSDIPTRIAQATELFNFIQTQGYENYIVCGDYNSPLHDPFSEQNASIYNQFLNVGCTLVNAGAFGILNTACNSLDWSEAFAIDNIIVSDAFTIDSAATNQAKLNNPIITTKIDHIPLYATISFNEVTL